VVDIVSELRYNSHMNSTNAHKMDDMIDIANSPDGSDVFVGFNESNDYVQTTGEIDIADTVEGDN
jgi:hypothetical protein